MSNSEVSNSEENDLSVKNTQKIFVDYIDTLITGEDYYVFPETTVTVCILKLKNGFAVVGESACVNKENFDAEEGRNWARENAKDKIWKLEGYSMKNEIYKKNNEPT